MSEVFIVERHLVLLNGSAAALPVRVFQQRPAAESFQLELEREMARLLSCPVQIGPHPSHVQPLGAVMAHVGVKGIAHGLAPSGLQIGVVVDPGAPRIIM